MKNTKTSIKKVPAPIRHSLFSTGGVWEIFSDDAFEAGMNMRDIHTANLIYRILPHTEKEEVFVFKNRFGPSRYIGIAGLQYAKAMAEQWISDSISNGTQKETLEKPK